MPESATCYIIGEDGQPQGPVKVSTLKEKCDENTYVWGPEKAQWTLATLMFDKQNSKLSPSSKWYTLDKKNDPQGPVDVRGLCDMFRDGDINDATYCWSPNEDMESWLRLRQIASLDTAIQPLRKQDPNSEEFKNEMPEAPTEGFLGYLQLLAKMQIDGNITLQNDELVTMFGTQRSADYMIRAHLEKNGMTTQEALNTIKNKKHHVTIYDCRFMFRNLEVSEKSLQRMFTPPDVSFPKVDESELIVIQEGEKETLLPNLEKIGVAHAIFDFADAEGSRRYHKMNSYRCTFYSQVMLLLGTVCVLLGTRQTFDEDDRKIISFAAGALMLLALGMHYIGQKSAREFSERTNRANQYIGLYAKELKPHALLAQLSEHVETLTLSERETLQVLAEQAK